MTEQQAIPSDVKPMLYAHASRMCINCTAVTADTVFAGDGIVRQNCKCGVKWTVINGDFKVVSDYFRAVGE